MRRIDLVLPSQEPVGVLLPEIMRLLGDSGAERPLLRLLVRADGSVLAPESSLAEAAVPDGAVLRLVRVEDAPSAPVIHDVSDEAANDLDVRAWQWGPSARAVVAGVAVAAGVAVTGMFAREAYGLASVAVALLGVAVAGLLAAVVVARWGQSQVCMALLGASAVSGVLGAWTAADAQSWPESGRWGAVAAVSVLALAASAWVSPLGRGGAMGAAAVALCAGGWEAALAVFGGPGVSRPAAVLAVVSLVVLGVLPRLAASTSGLSGLDDRRAGGVSVSRYEVATALAATHRGLVLAAWAVAVSATVAGVLVLRDPSVWTVLLSIVVALVLGLRARAFPLVAEVAALLMAGCAVTVALMWLWLQERSPTGPLTVLAVLTLLPFIMLTVQPAEHVRVRVRRFGDVLESVGVVAAVPLAIGVFGVYGRLLDTFA